MHPIFVVKNRPERHTRTTDSILSFSHRRAVPLAGSCSNFGSRALGSLLAKLCSLGGTLGLGSGELCLLSLLGSLGGSLLLLVQLDSLSAGGRSDVGSHGAALLDHIKRGTDDGSLGLDSSAGSLLGNFL